MKNIIIVFATNLLLTLGTQATFAEEHVFAPDEHCLAYKTEKVTFFFVDVEIIGKSCEVSAVIHWNASGEQAQVEVSVPVTTFDSGNALRDGDIPEILKVELTPNIRFISNWLNRADLQKMLESQKAEVFGNLDVAGGTFPVKFVLTFTSKSGYFLVEGRLLTSFAAFKVEVPSVVGGLIAEPKEFLELLVHLRSDKIPGTEKLTVQK